MTATGLNLLAFGSITLTVNGEPANLSDKVAFNAHCQLEVVWTFC